MLNIKSLNIENLGQCSKLFQKIFSSPPWNEQWDYQSALNHLEEIFMTPGFMGLGYFENDNLCGFMIGTCESWLHQKQYYINELCVDSHQQGKGIGSALMKRLKDELKAQEINKVYLLTLHNSDAQHFYQKHHFAVSDKMIVMGCKI